MLALTRIPPLRDRSCLVILSTMFFLDMDFQADRIVNKWLEIGVGIAHQDIPNSFKAVELVAAQETEVNGRISITTKPITFSSDVEWVASRNLLPYGYGGQYSQFVDGVASDPKLTTAPSYFVVNAKADYHLNRIGKFTWVPKICLTTRKQVRLTTNLIILINMEISTPRTSGARCAGVKCMREYA